MAEIKREDSDSVEVFIQQLLNNEFAAMEMELLRRFNYTFSGCENCSSDHVTFFFRRCIGVCLKELIWHAKMRLADNAKLTPAYFEDVVNTVNNTSHTLMLAMDTAHLSMAHYKNELYNMLLCTTVLISHRRSMTQKYFLED